MMKFPVRHLFAGLLVLSGLSVCSASPTGSDTPAAHDTSMGDSNPTAHPQSSESRVWDWRQWPADATMYLWRNKGGRWLALANVGKDDKNRVIKLMSSGPVGATMTRAELLRDYRIAKVASDRDQRLVAELADYLVPEVNNLKWGEAPELDEGRKRVAILPTGNFKVVTATGIVPTTMNKEFRYAFDPIDDIVIRMTHAPSLTQVPFGTAPRPQPPPMDVEESRVFATLWGLVTSSARKPAQDPAYNLKLTAGWDRNRETIMHNIHGKRKHLRVFVDAMISNANDLRIIDTVLKRSQPADIPGSGMVQHPAGSIGFMAMMATTGGQLLAKILFDHNDKKDMWGRKIITSVKISQDRPGSPTVVWHFADWSENLEIRCEQTRGISFPWKDRTLDGQPGRPGSIDYWLRGSSRPVSQPSQNEHSAVGQHVSSGLMNPPARPQKQPGPSKGKTSASYKAAAPATGAEGGPRYKDSYLQQLRESGQLLPEGTDAPYGDQSSSGQPPGVFMEPFWYDASLFDIQYSEDGVPTPRYAYSDPPQGLQPGSMYATLPDPAINPQAGSHYGTQPGRSQPPGGSSQMYGASYRGSQASSQYGSLPSQPQPQPPAYRAQPYGAQPYGAQPYGWQPGGPQPGSPQPGGSREQYQPPGPSSSQYGAPPGPYQPPPGGGGGYGRQ